MNGVLLVDKPEGLTSHDVVSKIKSITGSKTGHAGTLDPFATGLLVILIGEATKISLFLTGQDKSYEGTIVFGKKTDTFDVTGKIISETDSAFLKEEQVKEAFNFFTGKTNQTPPIYSAVKIKGEKSYKLARKGKTVELKPRGICVNSLKLTEFNPGKYPTASFKADVSKGTYIRALANDIGSHLKTGAFLEKLRRTHSGSFDLSQSIEIDDLDLQTIKKHILSIRESLDLPEINIKKEAIVLIQNGALLQSHHTDEKLHLNNIVKVIGPDGKILSIQRIGNGKSKNLMVFNESD